MPADLAVETISPDEQSATAEFIAFLKAASAARYPPGQMRRFNQGRASGCVEAEFTVATGLADGLKVGLFQQPRSYSAWIRFANATSASDREKDVRGMSIKVRDVSGQTLTPDLDEQDFILNSHPVMMVPGTREFLELLRANEAGGFRRLAYFLSHPRALRIGAASRSNPTCHLDLTYWSTTPYLFGPGRAVKYIMTPSSPRRSPRPSALTATYLRDAMRTRLTEADASFDFMVQLQTDSRRMPIEDASVEWRTSDSPHVPVASIRIPRQAIDDPASEARCEQLAFNPWHCLAEHRPLGNMNRARREIYAAMASFRAESVTT